LIPVHAAVRSIASPLCRPPFLPAAWSLPPAAEEEEEEGKEGRGVSEPLAALMRSDSPRAAGERVESDLRPCEAVRDDGDDNEGGSMSPPLPLPSRASVSNRRRLAVFPSAADESEEVVDDDGFALLLVWLASFRPS
jgi:hypothetical protein